MAGHSKWANIKHKKAKTDAKRSKVFTRIIRELVIAARLGGASQEDNPRLRSAVVKALAANMNKDTIERAIAKGAGAEESENVEELSYEGYAPGGVAIYVEAITDNRNRTVSEVRHAFTKYGGNLGTTGSVAYLFNTKGVIDFSPGVDEEKILELALEAGAEDIEVYDDSSLSVYTDQEHFGAVLDALKAADLEPDEAAITMIPETKSELDLEAAATHLKLIDMLEDLDDVQNVYSNALISNEIYEQLDS